MQSARGHDLPIALRAALCHARGAALALLLTLVTLPAAAIDAIVLEVGEIESGTVRVLNSRVRLDLLSDTQTRVTASADMVSAPAPIGKLTAVQVRCDAPTIAEPRFGCRDGRIAARGGPTGRVAARVNGEFQSDTGAAFVNGSGLVVAGATLDWRAQQGKNGWQVSGNALGGDLVALRKFAARWLELPADFTVEGGAAAQFSARGTDSLRAAELTATLSNINFTDADGSNVGEALAAQLTANFKPSASGGDIEMGLQSSQGQALLGPVLLDPGVNPLTLTAHGTLLDKQLTITQLNVSMRDLLVASGTAEISFAGPVPRADARLGIEELRFPAAYTSLLQIALAATDFGDLTTSGAVRGSAVITDNAARALTLQLADVALIDRKGKLRINDIAGLVQWRDSAATAPESTLRWSSGGAYGLSGGAAEIRFRTYANNFALTQPARLPVFDGAVAIESFALGKLGSDDLEIDFEAEIEPISMPLICEAFGWPSFAGTLSGRVPALTFRDGELRVGGDVEAVVFAGKVVGSNLRLQDPFGRWPRLFADVRARDLDLAAVTNTFAFGSITGRLEADVLGLELFAWSPVAFDARLATPTGDRSKKRISAKAVGNLSNIGGGGGGVIAALQSGFLRFFDDFGYSKLGLKCQLRDGVCLMSGIEPARNGGYYIVKGSGIPRIDIIGNAGRVDWPRLVSQISAGIEAESVEVR
ncbi:MAG: hypothetical protein IPG25_18560 [Proteobacteria bacterium]|nr:hypothetical protein [Pseudomonadota bacterium]